MVRITFWSTLVVATFAFAQPVEAQKDERGFGLQSFQSAPGFGSFLTLDGAVVPDSDLGVRTGLRVNYQASPLMIKGCSEIRDDDCIKNTTRTALVKHHATAEFLAALSLFRIFEFGLVIPIVVHQSGESIPESATLDAVLPPSTSGSLSDLRFHLKLDVLRGIFRYRGEHFGLAIVPVVTAPVGDAIHKDQFLGDSSFTVNPKLAFTVEMGRMRFGTNLGYLIRQPQEFYEALIGSRMTYGIASEIRALSYLSFVAEFFGESDFSADLGGSPLEVDGAARFSFPFGLQVSVGAGAGVIKGYGTPKYRVFAGVSYEFQKRKLRGRAEPEEDDAFVEIGNSALLDLPTTEPEEPESDSEPRKTPKKKVASAQGKKQKSPNPKKARSQKKKVKAPVPGKSDLAEPDQAKKTKPSLKAEEKKPSLPEPGPQKPRSPWDWDLIQIKKGACMVGDDAESCRKSDIDKDGIDNVQDRCPDEAEDIDEYQDRDGCPERDNDQDSVVDEKDACPQQPEDKDNHRDDDGCPDVDNDGDGVLDEFDRCPNETGNSDDPQDKFGCPIGKVRPKVPVRASIRGTEIEISHPIEWRGETHEIIGSLSFRVLEAVAEIFKENPNLRVEVGVHTNIQILPKKNRQLSINRAKAIKRYLVKLGVGKKQIVAKGHGETMIGSASGKSPSEQARFTVIP